ncbi:hypothetical protein KCU98_g332, partial [Aureobasidium melanogenum]
MARLTDLPPEARLKIYKLLLVDPIRDELRVTMTFDPFDNNKITWGRARCAQTEQPHKEGHSADPCCVDVPPFTVHHLDFTDLWSLARASKKFYLEASETIYNNADLTYASGRLVPVTKPLKSTPGFKSLSRSLKSLELNFAFKSLSRYLEQHSAVTCSMLHSLVINDVYNAMTPQDMKLIVDLVNARLPGLQVLGYQVSTDIGFSLNDLMMSSSSSIAHTVITIQPFARLRRGTRTFLEVPIPAKLASALPQVYDSLCDLRERLLVYAAMVMSPMAKLRRAANKRHELTLHRGDYLCLTLALRSMSVVKAQTGIRTANLEEKLYALYAHGSLQVFHRSMLEAARTLRRDFS